MKETSAITSEQVNAALKFTLTLGQAIHAAGPAGIPSGHLYAQVMGVCPSLSFYTRAIDFLKEKGICREERSHLLVSLLPFA